MDAWRIEAVTGESAAPSAVSPLTAGFGAAGLTLRLAALRRSIERAYPLTLCIDIADREAADGLAPDLTEAIHRLLGDILLAAARDGGTMALRVAVAVKRSAVALTIAGDGRRGAKSDWLVARIAALGGTLRRSAGRGGTVLDMTLPVVPIRPASVISANAAARAARPAASLRA